MSLEASGISWTDGTLNSLYGCSAVSVGCRLCYAVNRVHRHSCNAKLNRDGRFDGLVREHRFTGQILFDPKHLYAVLKDRDPKMIFVNEFSDLLHEALPIELILEHVRVFKAAACHKFQILTKRGHRLSELDAAILAEFGSWPRNVWMGVSVCSDAQIEVRRIDLLGATSAAMKWVSFEPWVSDVNHPLRSELPELNVLLRKNQIGWTVIGGESGPRDETNLMTLDDARYLVDESKAAGCRVHFKQLGTALAVQLGVFAHLGRGEHRGKGGSPDQWPKDLNLREWPEASWDPVTDVSDFCPVYDAGEWQRFRVPD